MDRERPQDAPHAPTPPSTFDTIYVLQDQNDKFEVLLASSAHQRDENDLSVSRVNYAVIDHRLGRHGLLAALKECLQREITSDPLYQIIGAFIFSVQVIPLFFKHRWVKQESLLFPHCVFAARYRIDQTMTTGTLSSAR